MEKDIYVQKQIKEANFYKRKQGFFSIRLSKRQTNLEIETPKVLYQKHCKTSNEHISKAGQPNGIMLTIGVHSLMFVNIFIIHVKGMLHNFVPRSRTIIIPKQTNHLRDLEEWRMYQCPQVSQPRPRQYPRVRPPLA